MKQDPYVVCDLNVVPGLQVFQGAVVPREVSAPTRLERPELWQPLERPEMLQPLERPEHSLVQPLERPKLFLAHCRPNPKNPSLSNNVVQ